MCNIYCSIEYKWQTSTGQSYTVRGVVGTADTESSQSGSQPDSECCSGLSERPEGTAKEQEDLVEEEDYARPGDVREAIQDQICEVLMRYVREVVSTDISRA